MKILRTSTAAVIVAVALGLSFAAQAAPDGPRTYSVTITNATRGQLITPPVVIVHDGGFRLFTVGEPASAELVPLAEDGITDDLVASLETNPNVYSFAVAAGGIEPGASMTVQVESAGQFRGLTLVGMLASTNDAFVTVHRMRLPNQGALVVHGAAYDAGSEANSESCAFIPGPPCGMPMVRDTGAAEGFVHVHSGIHGLADLVPADHDWRNPVAEILVERVN